MRRWPAIVLVLPVLAWLAGACHRNLEPYDPDEKVQQPDLSRIFPEGARQADAQQGDGGIPLGSRGAPPVASEGAPLSGTVRLEPALEGRAPAGATLFLIARTSDSGPPVAVKRIAQPRFPVDFEIGPRDRMLQTIPFEGPFRITARLDADGNAMTRNPGDLQSDEELHGPGERGIELVIDQVL